MKPTRIRVPTSLASRIRNLHPTIRARVRVALEQILAEPTVGKELREELEGLRSFRLGRYRIVYRVQVGTVILINLGPRSAIYAETASLLENTDEE